MYEGDTMTQIFKRTKKCCAKLIRKLTFNTSSPVNMPIKLRNTTTAQYMEQKSGTCGEDNTTKTFGITGSSPTNSFGVLESPNRQRRVETGWDLARDNEKLPSARGCSNNGNSCASNKGCPDDMLSYEEAGDEEDYQMFHISPRFFLKRDMTMSYMRVGDDSGGGDCGGGGRRNCNFTPRLGMTNLMASMILSRRDLGKWNKSQNNNSSCCSDDEIVTNMKDGSSDAMVLATDERIDVREYIDVNTNSSTNAFRRNEGVVPGRKIQLGCIGSDNENVKDKWNKNEGGGTTTTSFIVPETLTVNGHIGSRGNGKHSPGCYQCPASNPIEISNRTETSATKGEPVLCTQIVFEKVKFDKSKRYLRHTPSESSIVSSPRSARSNGRLLSRDPSISSSFSLDDNSFSDNNLYSSSSPSHSLCSHVDDGHLENGCSFDPNGNCCHLSIRDSDPIANPSEKTINRTNISRCHEYSENWDSNGNSADSRRILCEEAWNVFENKINTARDKKMMILYTEDAEDYIRSSSPRSSSTTLETWIDDEVYDNSFNEELERHRRHCASSLER